MIQRRTSVVLAAAALAVVALAQSAMAQDARVAQQVKLRQSAYTVLGAQMGQMGAMASGRAPFDAATFRTAAERAAFMGAYVSELFPAGSTSPASKAKAELWQQQADFQKLMKDMQAKTAALANVAKGGDLEAIKPAFGAAGASCKACHDKYKAD
ncbi:MAG: cytochrome c [Gammaproteobacteria bacterium]|nr:cytochrome c [Gammaproteobacteria bacterium]